MKRAVVLVITIAAFAAPASALGAVQLVVPIPGGRSYPSGDAASGQLPLNYASDRRAMNAYATYLNTLLNNTSNGNANDSSYIQTISGLCKGALAPLTQSNQQVDTAVQHTLTVLGQEMGDDLAITFDQAATSAFTRFSNTLTRLRWTRFSGWPYAVRHYINTESQVLSLPVSALCANASSAQLRPGVVPASTKSFIKAYNEASRLANNALNNLTRMMQAYEVPSERGLVSRISNLAGEVSSQTKGYLLSGGSALTSVLESN